MSHSPRRTDHIDSANLVLGMGWVGAGLVIATTAYFCYRLSSRSSTEPRSFAPSEPKPETPLPGISSENVQKKHETRATTPPVESEDDTKETPKASASIAPLPVLAVPDLNLSGSATSQPATTPSISQPTNEPTGRLMPENGSTNSYNLPSQPSSTAAPAVPKQPYPPRPATTTTTTGTSTLMPPPPIPRVMPQPNRDPRLRPPRLGGSSLAPPPSAAASRRGPPISGTRQVNSTLGPTPVTLKKPTKRVVLEPGFSPLDWAALTSNPNNQLRGKDLPPSLLRVTPSMLKQQHGRKGRDAWTSYNGKVYNISPYVPYHPGGKGELLRGAGKDSGELFMEIHPWVNWDGILGECLIGILVSENDTQAENALDAMD